MAKSKNAAQSMVVHRHRPVRLPRTIKLSDEEIRLVQRASALLGLPYTSFLRMCLMQCSRSILRQHESGEANALGLPTFKLDFAKLNTTAPDQRAADPTQGGFYEHEEEGPR